MESLSEDLISSASNCGSGSGSRVSSLAYVPFGYKCFRKVRVCDLWIKLMFRGEGSPCLSSFGVDFLVLSVVDFACAIEGRGFRFRSDAECSTRQYVSSFLIFLILY